MPPKTDPQSLKHAVLRNDLSSFIQRSFRTVNPGTRYLHNWHIDLIAEYLTACEKGEITRLIINMPPRYLKSLSISVAWPAWLLGHDPARRIIAASYAQGLSLKHSLDARRVITAPWYREIFPELQLAADQNEKAKFMTTQQGFRFATSVGGTITGEGGNYLIVDDPHNPTHIYSQSARHAAIDWFDHTFASRLDDKKRGVFAVVMQRLHADDLTGHLLEKGTWEQLLIPAKAEREVHHSFNHLNIIRPPGDLLHPEREGEKELSQIAADLGSIAYQAQYQQQPVVQEDGIIHRDWLRYYGALPEGCIIQSWDTAIKAGQQHDRSVCATWLQAEGNHYLVDVTALRLEYPALKRQIIALAKQHNPEAILIEDKASGQSLLQDLRKETDLKLIAIMPTQDKLTRLAQVSVMVESGRVLLPKKAPWLEEFLSELLGFPAAAHDDMVDVFSQYLNWTRGKKEQSMRIRSL